ncbi:hypothetical protein BC828DRAFT_33256 [Blastocladiella britannica]|nr:hypothetical protein BC828DRAFT_33256 [Blastocladiella britannica]
MAPILVKDFTTKQTATHVYVTITWPQLISAKTANVYANDLYAKINAAPFFFELDLALPIADQEATCTFDGMTVILTLPKLHTDIGWPTITFVASSTDKTLAVKEIRDRRRDAEMRHLAREKDDREAREKEKWEKQRWMVQQQMEVERSERQQLADAKESEEQTAAGAVYDWASTATAPAHKEKEESPVNAIQELEVDDESSDDDDPEIMVLRQKYAQTKIRQDSGILEPTSDSQPAIPLPRSRGTIGIRFTPRQFVSAARETQDIQWAAQMEEARRRRTPHDTEAEKLENKAMSLQSQGQWLLAVDAYSALLGMTPKNHRAYVGRCECYAQLSFQDLAAADARMALALIQEMEEAHEIRGVYDQAKAQLRMHIEESQRTQDAA